MKPDSDALSTILIPTFNRPDFLSSQLTYIFGTSPSQIVIVLDSSEEIAAGKNRAIAQEFPNVEYRQFRQDIPVFSKFSDGADFVKTPFLVFLPDDDFLWLNNLSSMIDALLADSSSVAAHGVYFEYSGNRAQVDVTSLIHTDAEVIADKALDRVFALMSCYEALTYAVYRTAVARQALFAASSQNSILAQELLAGAVTAVMGKIIRLPIITHGRRVASTAGYNQAHPVEWLATDPAGMFSAYFSYRSILIDSIAALEPDIEAEEITRQVDLAHLCYLQPFLEPHILKNLINVPTGAIRGKNEGALALDLWRERYDRQNLGETGLVSTAKKWLKSFARKHRLRLQLQRMAPTALPGLTVVKPHAGFSVRFHSRMTEELGTVPGLENSEKIYENLGNALYQKELRLGR